MIRHRLPRVALIIVNWNSWRDSLECLESVFRLDYLEYLTVLVDNGSTDDSLQRIRKWCQGKSPRAGRRLMLYTAAEAERGGQPSAERKITGWPSSQRLVLIDIGENLGFAEGNNVAFRYLLQSTWKPDFFFLLNNDAKIEKKCLFHAVSLAERSRAGVIGARILDAEGRSVIFAGDYRRPEFFFRKNRKQPEWMSEDRPSIQALGSGMLISREALLAHQKRYGHFFNPQLFMYGEETEFCLDLLKISYKILISEQAVVCHKGGQSVEAADRNPMQLYYMTRNSIAIARKTLSLGWLLFFHLIYAPVRLRMALSHILQGEGNATRAILQGIRDGYLGRLGKWRHHPHRQTRGRG